MGADDAILISDPALGYLDTQSTALILAAAIKSIGAVDMAFFGRQAIDADAGMVPVQTARLLGWPALTLASVIKVEARHRSCRAWIEEGARSSLPNCPFSSV